ncbi:hypothetical protein C2G38_2042202 [Gigaspora rosea]|uniref:Uncharacterized protein n=1 Tax=Gigaspora rosea TaxID=44941 RepID=A0A397UXN0_9GLOM|nr:hypothetical protein C2G38_2042202 [Gigaspora rosea]
MEEDNYKMLVKYLTDLSMPPEYDGIQTRKLKAQARYFFVQEGILYRKTKSETLSPLQVVQRRKVKLILDAIHESTIGGHMDLNRGDSRDPFMLFEIPGEDWDRKLDHFCRKLLELNTQKKSNAQILEAYYQMGTILAEKEWNDATKKKLNFYFWIEKRKSVWKISKRVYQLFNARGEEYLYLVEHINITILEKMYDEDFTDRLLPEAQIRRQDELYYSLDDSQELISPSKELCYD